MGRAMHSTTSKTMRTARCACGSLSLTVRGEPANVYACACVECQRATGSAFAYRARYLRDAIVSLEGERRAFRRSGDSGRWIEQVFCPRCGTLVYMEGEAIPDAIVVSVGCFAEPGFAPPRALFWAGRRHAWYHLPDPIRLVE